MITALFSPFVSVAHAVTISMSIPGTNPNSSSTSPGAFIANFYQFALMIGGILAFGVVVYGGVKYMTSAGNPSGQGDAKEWIEAALLGLLLLVGAYFILNVINPQLTNLTMPTLQTVNITSTATGCNITCPSGYSPTTIGGAGTSQPSASCVCENASGTQGCGGSVAGTSTSCPTSSTCTETQKNPITYSCVQNSTMCGGTNYGTCPVIGQVCKIAAGGNLSQHYCTSQ